MSSVRSSERRQQESVEEQHHCDLNNAALEPSNDGQTITGMGPSSQAPDFEVKQAWRKENILTFGKNTTTF